MYMISTKPKTKTHWCMYNNLVWSNISQLLLSTNKNIPSDLPTQERKMMPNDKSLKHCRFTIYMQLMSQNLTRHTLKTCYLCYLKILSFN